MRRRFRAMATAALAAAMLRIAVGPCSPFSVTPELMRETADSIYDSATQQSYLRLNLQSALDAVMNSVPTGTTQQTAEDLGPLDWK